MQVIGFEGVRFKKYAFNAWIAAYTDVEYISLKML